MDRSLENTLAEITIIKASQNCLLGGVHNDNGVWSLASPTLSVFLTLGDVCLSKSSQIFFLVDPNHSIVGGFLQLITPLLLQIGDAEVDWFPLIISDPHQTVNRAVCHKPDECVQRVVC